MKVYICSACGKKHTRRPGNQFKLTYDHKTRHFCGYNCYMKIVKLKENKKHEEIRSIFESTSLQCLNTSEASK